jgi:hypothetical protein
MPTQPDLAALSTSVKNATPPTTKEDNNFDRVMRLAIADPSVFRALRDLIEAITETHVAPVACGRAMGRVTLTPNTYRGLCAMRFRSERGQSRIAFLNI